LLSLVWGSCGGRKTWCMRYSSWCFFNVSIWNGTIRAGSNYVPESKTTLESSQVESRRGYREGHMQRLKRGEQRLERIQCSRIAPHDLWGKKAACAYPIQVTWIGYMGD
jgi:hypothetical protein